MSTILVTDHSANAISVRKKHLKGLSNKLDLAFDDIILHLWLAGMRKISS